LVYEYPHEDPGDDIFFTTRIGFTIKEDGVVELARDFSKVRKVPFTGTFKFKIILIAVLITFSVVTGILLSLNNWFLPPNA
jgi:hypothetical protein